MKKVFFIPATILSLIFTSCNSCGSCNVPQGTVIETDSIFMVNDSTIGDLQTYTFVGNIPMNNGNLGDVLLTIQTINLNADGTYTITTDYIDEGLATESDNGDMFVMIGMPNDTTAIIYEFVSANGNPKMNFQLMQDSTLVKLDNKMQPSSNNPAHKLMHKK